MKLNKFLNFTLSVISVVLICEMFAGNFVAAVKYADIEAIEIEKLDFPTFEEWHTSEYSSEISAFSDKSTENRFIAPIEPIKDTDWTEINDREGLENIALNMNGKYYLSDDIDLGDTEWVPIGDSADKFKGIFDGQGYVIKNLKIGEEGTPQEIQSAGLFGYVENATIQNVGVSGTIYSSSYTGVIFGYGTGTNVSNCYNAGNVSTSFANADSVAVGGLFGYGTGIIISNCYNAGNVSVLATNADSAYVGGLFGFGYGTATSNCYNTGSVSVLATNADSASVGGLFGSDYSTTISNCYNIGTVFVSTANSAYVGGLFGFSRGTTINNCYNTGDISVTTGTIYFIGSIFGADEVTVAINNCYWNSGSEQLLNNETILPKKGVGTGTDTTTSRTSDEMKQKSYFVGFDFDTVWDLNEDINNGYPFFRSKLSVVLDFTSLLEIIEAAISAADNVIVSTDGSELWKETTDKFWVTAEAKDKFYQALTNSYKVIAEAISQSEIDLAAANLDKAIQDFEKEKNLGTGVLIDYQVLIEKIDEAIEAKANVITSENGSELSALPEYNGWVTEDVMDRFNSAIMSAVNKLTSTNQTEIHNAANDLDIEIQKFLSKINRGTGKFATNYTIQENFIFDISLQTNRLTFASNFYPENETDDLIVNIYTSSGKLLEDVDNVGTGMIVKIMIAGQIAGEFEAVIHGDVTGDGSADIEDAKVFLESLVGNTTLTDACARAVEDYSNRDSAIKSLRAFLNFVMSIEY